MDRAPRPGRFLLFELSGARCAIPLESVHEVVRAVEITSLPGAPEIVEGVIDVRGDVVPVVDVRARLGLRSAPLRASQFIVVAQAGERRVGIRVDGMEWIESLAEDDVAAPERIVRGLEPLAGVARAVGGLVLLYDPDGFLRQAESEVLDAALADRAALDVG
jgi:purine-binding chemotaxis protein CheW